MVYLGPFFTFLCFSIILLFKMAPEHSAEVLASVPKYNKALTYLMEKIYVLNEVCSGISYGVVCYECRVTKSTIY